MDNVHITDSAPNIVMGIYVQAMVNEAETVPF